MALRHSGRAIGAVTRLIEAHLLNRGFTVSVGKPEVASTTNTAAKLNLFLYEAAFDPHLRNLSLRDGEPPPLWLVLRYLLTAFDDAEQSDTIAAHELLGRGIAALQQLNFPRLQQISDANIVEPLESSPEPLKLTFDETTADLLSKVMQGSEERYRLSVTFQVRPVMIAPAILPRATLLVGINYQTAAVIGEGGIELGVIPSMGTKLERVEPDRVEADGMITIFGTDVAATDEVLLGGRPLVIDGRMADRVSVRVESPTGLAPLASGLSAGELPLVARRQLTPNRMGTSNLVVVRVLPTVASAALVGDDLRIAGFLLGRAGDDVMVLLVRPDDGVTVRAFDVVAFAADQRTLTIGDATNGTAAGIYRVLVRINNQQARNSPSVPFP